MKLYRVPDIPEPEWLKEIRTRIVKEEAAILASKSSLIDIDDPDFAWLIRNWHIFPWPVACAHAECIKHLVITKQCALNTKNEQAIAFKVHIKLKKLVFKPRYILFVPLIFGPRLSFHRNRL